MDFITNFPFKFANPELFDCYSLLNVFCSLLVTFCLLLVTFCSLFFTAHLKFITFCSLLITFYLLLVIFSSFFVDCSLLFSFYSLCLKLYSLLVITFYYSYCYNLFIGLEILLCLLFTARKMELAYFFIKTNSGTINGVPSCAFCSLIDTCSVAPNC